MLIRILSIEDAALGERTPHFGCYRVVIEADGTSEDFTYTVELPNSGGQSIRWEPSHSFLSDRNAVPIMVVAAITDTVVRFHRGSPVQFPHVVTPRPVGPNTVVVSL